MQQIFLPAEWHSQSGVQLTWPHVGTDWADILDEVIVCYLSISREIIKREKLRRLLRLKIMRYLLGGVASLILQLNNLIRLLRNRNRRVNKFKTMSIKCIRIIYRLLQLKLLQN